MSLPRTRNPLPFRVREDVKAASCWTKTSTETEKAEGQTEIDDYIRKLDSSMNSVDGGDFDGSKLSDSELGL